MQITEKKSVEIKRQLRVIKKELEVSLEELRVAAAMGDLRENEEYSTSRANSERLLSRKMELEGMLSEADIISVDNGPRITVGSVVEVVKLGLDGKAVTAARQFTIETEGDTVLRGVLGTESPLGQEVLNGTDGVYFVHNNGGIRYRVTKIVQ